MKLHKSFFLFVQAILVIPWFWGVAQAGPNACTELAHPLHSKVNAIKDRGGMWARFERGRKLQNHSALALKIDSKIIGLMFTLDYLCATLDGIPYNDVAEYIVPQVREIGEEGFIKKHVELGHSLKDVTDWVNYGKFSEENRNRKLELAQIKQTMEQAQNPVERYERLYRKTQEASAVIAETKALIADIEKIHTTDPYLMQADYENNQVPFSSILSNSGDAM